MTTKIKINNKAAMFGLDARIALAIFGALSVITGAALFSAIKTSKATAYLTRMTEVGKAWEAYYLDTGFPLMTDPVFGTRTDVLNSQSLIEDPGLPGWKGPYLDTEYYDGSYASGYRILVPRIDPSVLAAVELKFQNTNTNWDSGHHYYRQCRTAGWKCGIWVAWVGFPDDSIFNEIDRIVDGSDGPWEGLARKKDNVIHLMVAPFKNPKD